MGQSAKVDEEAMEACLKEVTKALLEVRPAPPRRAARRCVPPRRCLGLTPPPLSRAQSDVNVGLVVQLKKARQRAAACASALPTRAPALRRTL